MRKVLLLLAILALAIAMVRQADAAPVKHRLATRHHKSLVKKHSVRRLARHRHHSSKVAV